MKNFLLIALCFISLNAFADTVKCYSGGKLFYEGKFKDVMSGDGFIAIRLNGSVDVITGDCVVNLKDIPIRDYHKKA